MSNVFLQLSKGVASKVSGLEVVDRGDITVMCDSQTEQVFDWKEAAFVIVEWDSGLQEIYAVQNLITKH